MVVIAWDDGTDKTFSVWGVLDPQKGLLRRSSSQAGVAYPVVATNGQIAVTAGLRLATREIAIFTESLKPMAVVGITKE